jgi:hypothetical protein
MPVRVERMRQSEDRTLLAESTESESALGAKPISASGSLIIAIIDHVTVKGSETDGGKPRLLFPYDKSDKPTRRKAHGIGDDGRKGGR